MERLIDLEHLLKDERHNVKEIIILTKSDNNCNMNLAVLNRDMYNIFKVKPFGLDEWEILAYDRYMDESFKGFSYLELSNVEVLGDAHFVHHNSVPSRTAVSHHISMKTKVSLNANLILTPIYRLSMAVKETYNLLNDCVVVIPVFKTTED